MHIYKLISFITFKQKKKSPKLGFSQKDNRTAGKVSENYVLNVNKFEVLVTKNMEKRELSQIRNKYQCIRYGKFIYE